ncbi:MAG TPA: YukJ family protein [Puia sp.]|nr:YukJ family protein [Puia sp.]
MPIPNYGVLAGRVFARRLATTKDEHYHLLLNRGNDPQRAAVNTQSTTPPSKVLYYSTTDFQHPITNAILAAFLPIGNTPLTSAPGGLALDFVRMDLFPAGAMKPLSGTQAGTSTDLNDQLDITVQAAINDPTAVLYAFGQHWQDASGADEVFPEIDPSKGTHDIHMNQGNPKGSFYKDNGVYQDGALLFHFPAKGSWTAVFVAFQSESFTTDNGTGDPL